VSTSRLSVAGDPALALVVRIFVGSVAEQWKLPEPVRADLRLAASELFSGAVEAGHGDLVRFEVSTGEGEMELRAEDVAVEHEGADLEGWTSRFALIRALFPGADVSDTSVRIRVPLTS
jgi:anti-sigma regulatory factor (Ser/Thr protein kinase)